MNIFVNALSKEREGIMYLKNKLRRLNKGKFKEGIFIGPQVKAMPKDEEKVFRGSFVIVLKYLFIHYGQMLHINFILGAKALDRYFY